MLIQTDTAIPDLHEVVLDALELHASYDVPGFRIPLAQKHLVVASGNALPTAKILFSDENAVICDEGQYRRVLGRDPSIDSAFVVSASGAKHAPMILADLLSHGLPCQMLTCAPQSLAASMLPESAVFVSRSRPEPITYNTSTYMGMILMKTREDPAVLRSYLLENVQPLMRDVGTFDAFYLMVPPEFDVTLPMFVTKFDELFGGRLVGRCYTTEQTLHAKTVVPWEQELFITFGASNPEFGLARLQVPLPPGAGFAAMIATAYYVIGQIQAQKYPWFKENAARYAEFEQRLFRNLYSGAP